MAIQDLKAPRACPAHRGSKETREIPGTSVPKALLVFKARRATREMRVRRESKATRAIPVM